MDKKQKEEWFELFGQAFREVMIPVLENLEEKLTKKIDVVDERAERIEDKLDKHTDRMDRHGKKLEDLDERVIALETPKS